MFTKCKVDKINNVKKIQKQSLQTSNDDYMVGLYNGLEIAAAILEDREPVFECCVSEPEIVQTEDKEVGRTLHSGIRRRT